MIKESAPYVVSLDKASLLNGWSRETGYSVPAPEYLEGMEGDLRCVLAGYFNGVVEMVSDREIKIGLEQMIGSSRFPVYSLDRAYIGRNSVSGFIDVTRGVDENLQSIGLIARPGYPPIEHQFRQITQSGEPEIILVDDVIFSGKDLVETICPQLQKLGSKVVKIHAGIGVGTGVELLRNNGFDVECVREFPIVVDEVCERDFFAGVPMSGRTLIDKEGRSWSAPYLRPFGDPISWASIPREREYEFSQFCLELSIKLWSEVERLSQAGVPVEAVPRQLRNINLDGSITKALREVKAIHFVK